MFIGFGNSHSRELKPKITEISAKETGFVIIKSVSVSELTYYVGKILYPGCITFRSLAD
jgi:hypothetical protein